MQKKRREKDKAVHRLLILSCSARKHQVAGEVAAWDLYDGVAFRVLKQLQKEGRFPEDVDILILSARYGLIRPHDKITFYDQRMNRRIAEHQAPHNCALLRRMMSAGKYTEVFVNVGRTYLLALHPFATWVSPSVKIVVAAGGIGRKLRQMKQWLLRSATTCDN